MPPLRGLPKSPIAIFKGRAEEEKELAVAEARSAAVEEFKAGPAFEELFREKSE